MSSFKLAALAVAGAFITYFSMYAFRKPFTAAEYNALTLWGLDYKIVLVIAQVAGYTASKFLGIKVVSEMKPAARIRSILGLIGVAWLAVLGFGIIPHPYNWVCLILNGLPLGMIWGVVFAFLEGRRQTELLAAGLASSFIVASGVVKSVGQGFILNGIPEFWMPFVTGAVFIPTLLLGVWLLSLIPPPDAEDEASRTERLPMSAAERKRFFLAFAPGIVIVVLVYMALNAYRDFRDNFAVEIWRGLGFADQPEVLTYAELPIAVAVLVISALMILIRNNRMAFYVNFVMIALGGLAVLVTTVLFMSSRLDPAVWMITVGFGMYLAYMFYHTMFFERWIALFRYRSNIGFLMYLCDSFGYLASVGVMLYKDFFAGELSWLRFFTQISLIMGVMTLALSLIGVLYFLRREKRWQSAAQPEQSMF